MPHALVSFTMVLPKGTTEKFTDIFGCGEHHVKETARLDELAGGEPRRVFRVGYGKLDIQCAEYELFRSTAERAKDALPTVLLAPSWGESSILDRMGSDLIAELLDRGCRVVLRPHPMLLDKKDPQLDTLQKRYGQMDLFSLDDPRSGNDTIFRADAMISDFSGVAFEFAYLRERPVVFVDLPKKALNPHWRDVGIEPLEIAIRPEIGVVAEPEPRAVADATAGALDAVNEWPDRIRASRASRLYNMGTCALHAADAIHTLIEEARGASRGEGPSGTVVAGNPSNSPPADAQ